MILEESTDMVVKIKWVNFVKNTYTFGSQVSFIKDKVVFENPLMSPSFTMTSWSSRTNFQGHRSQPDLPLLKRGGSYQVHLEATVRPADSLYVKVTYFDRLGEVIGFDVLKDQSWLFTYPLKAFHYTIDLINAGCEQLIFDYLEIAERDDRVTAGIDLQDLAVYFPQETDQLNVLFLEKETLSVADLPREVLENLGNVVLVGDQEAANDFYLSQEFENKLSDYLWFYHDNNLTQVNVIAYGPRGALAAVYYASKFNAQLYLDQPLADKSYYQKQLSQSSRINRSLLPSIFDRLTYVTKVHYYSSSSDPEELSLVSQCFDRAYRLKSLSLIKPDQD